jgi:hypothetical protein
MLFYPNIASIRPGQFIKKFNQLILKDLNNQNTITLF